VALAAPGPAIYTFVKMAWCTTARSSGGYPQFPLEKYTTEDIRREYLSEKDVRSPIGTVSCVHQVSVFDSWRAPQFLAPAAVSSNASGLVQIE